MWSLPINAVCTLDMTMPQWELGRGFSCFDQRDPGYDEIMCAQTLRKIGNGVGGSWLTSGTSATCSIGTQFETPMLGTPSVSYLAASAVINTPGDATFTDSGSTTAGSASISSTGAQITLTPGGTWSGSPTAFRPARCRTDFILLSAE